eukprot:GHVL01041362.1.p1 GENE.GHVL01041362.1~~GHVL01041362.1.p1  ORF type:complete len:102 (-),score=24.07 GHVL01041362.1:58-363(-)
MVYIYIDFDMCLEDPCDDENSICTPRGDSFECTCMSGYTSVNGACEGTKNECLETFGVHTSICGAVSECETATSTDCCENTPGSFVPVRTSVRTLSAGNQI